MRSLAELEARVAQLGAAIGVQIVSFTSNHEGDFLDWIHENADEIDGIIINPAGLTEYGLASRHAIRDSGKPTIEVHFANIKRHPHKSIFTKHVVGIVHGLRKHSYTAALVAMVAMLDDQDYERPELYRPRAASPPSA
jgi:3-dehydroquinate dehydratase-2